MSDPRSALEGARFEGYATVAETGPQGMVTIRGDFAAPEFRKAVEGVVGVAIPEARGIATGNSRALAWMSPDELLLLLPHAEAPAAETALTEVLGGSHALAVNVSDARAMFEVTGPAAREVIAKVAPVDMSPGAFAPDILRRTRIAQVAAAVWMTGDGTIRVVCFRSVAQYVFDVLAMGARPGAEVGAF